MTKKGTVPKSRAWCGSPCERFILRNHLWEFVRYDVLKRDNFQCVICTEDDKGALAQAYHRLHGKTYLEVNHINPVNGRRSHFSCDNHLENLETLCHPCHVAVTKQQRDAGLIRNTKRHFIQFLRLTSGTTIMCSRCKAVFPPQGWAAARREECTGDLVKNHKKPLRKKR